MRDIFTPLFLAVLAALFWVDAANINPFVFTPLALALFAVFLVLFAFKKNKPAYVAVTLALVLLICGSFARQKDAFELDRQLRLPGDGQITIRGRLLAYPEIGNGFSQLLLCAESFAWPGRSLDRALNVRVLCHGDCRDFGRGDRIEVAARIIPGHLNRNFFPNPFEKYLLVKKIHLNATCKSAQLVERLERAHAFWQLIGSWRERIRQAIEGRYLAGGRLQPAGIFLEATILGDRGRLENSTQEELIASGVFHLLAISGANIGMLALFSLLLCRWLRVPMRSRYLITAILLLLFLAVSGFDISAQRAVLMALLLFVARAGFIDVHAANIISFCGLLLLVFNPAQFLDPGYILTFALTAALLSGRRILLPVLRRLPRFLAELLAANFSASLLALPLALYFFQRFSFAGFFSGLLLVPLAGAITVCGALLLVLAWLPDFFIRLALLPAGILLHVFFAVSRWFFQNLALNIFRPAPPLWLLALIVLSFFLVFHERLKMLWRIAPAVALAGMLLFISLSSRPYRPGRLEVYFLDVGHGDAQVVVFPGGDALLIDGGGASFSDFEVGRRLVLPFLLQKKIYVRWVAVSHYHPDHARGLVEIIGIIAPAELWLASAAADSEMYRQLLAAKPGKTALIKIRRGFVKKVAGCSITCLAPPAFIDAGQSANDHSMVLRVTDGRHGFLFSGDIEKDAESELVDANAPGLASVVLKIPHHGSRTSSSSRFLAAVRPRVAVISTPAYSSYGFPHAEVIARLKRLGVRWLTTARCGGVMIAPAAGGLEIEVSK